MRKLFAILNVLRKGSAVADPALWKKGGLALQAAIAALAMSLNPILKASYDVEIPAEVAGALGLVVAWIVGLFFTVATTDKLGLPGLAPDVPPNPAPHVPAEMDLRGGP